MNGTTAGLADRGPDDDPLPIGAPEDDEEDDGGDEDE
jgi:hypothetical protein